MHKEIKINIRNKRATTEGAPVIICGNSDYTVSFTFDDEWDAQGFKTARFVYVKDGEAQHEDVVFKGSEVAVPVLSGIDLVKIGVFAGALCTTTPARVPCERSVLCGSGVPADPTPEVYNQLMEKIDEYYNALLTETTTFIEAQEELRADYLKKLEEGYFTGPEGPAGPQGPAGQAGATGPSGVTVPTSGFFTLEVDSATGDLYCLTADDAQGSPFVLEEDGSLYYTIEEE